MPVQEILMFLNFRHFQQPIRFEGNKVTNHREALFGSLFDVDADEPLRNDLAACNSSGTACRKADFVWMHGMRSFAVETAGR